MSTDFSDLKRLKITDRTRAWLAAESHSGGRSQPIGDVIELDSYLVLEGDAAGDTIRRYFDSAVRATLAAGDAP